MKAVRRSLGRPTMKHSTATFLLSMVLFTSCKKMPCDDPSSLPSKTSAYLINKWECKNTAKVKSDIERWMAERNWCEESQGKEGILSSLICTFIANKVRGMAVQKINNELKWNCNPDLIGKDAATAFTAICSAIPY